MHDDTELKKTFYIIAHSTLEDAIILDENYQRLMKESTDADKPRLKDLRIRVKNRIKELQTQ